MNKLVKRERKVCLHQPFESIWACLIYIIIKVPILNGKSNCILFFCAEVIRFAAWNHISFILAVNGAEREKDYRLYSQQSSKWIWIKAALNKRRDTFCEKHLSFAPAAQSNCLKFCGVCCISKIIVFLSSNSDIICFNVKHLDFSHWSLTSATTQSQWRRKSDLSV